MNPLVERIIRNVDWSLKTPSAKTGFVVMVLGEIALGIVLIYVMFFR